MKVIGVTGGIATGKSTVTAMLAELGAEVIDADAVAREVVEPGRPAWQQLLAAFGPGILLEDGHVNRRYLGRLVFGRPDLVERLNRATHPFIVAAIRRRLAELAGGGTRVAVVDAPLLFEAGLEDLVDEIWVVTAPREMQLDRLLQRDPDLTEDEAQARIDSQMPLEEKIRRAHVVIDNSGDLAATGRQVREAWRSAMRSGIR